MFKKFILFVIFIFTIVTVNSQDLKGRLLKVTQSYAIRDSIVDTTYSGTIPNTQWVIDNFSSGTANSLSNATDTLILVIDTLYGDNTNGSTSISVKLDNISATELRADRVSELDSIQINGVWITEVGITDHSLLTNRDIADQHTINSITNLSDTLSDVYDSLLNGNLHSASESQIPYFDGTIWQTTTDVSAINVSLLYYNMWSNTWNATTDPTADGQILTYRVNGGEDALAFEWESPATTFSEITATSATFDTVYFADGTYFVTNVLTYDGIRNTGLGLFVFEDLTSGASNTAFGWSSLTNNTEGSNNVAYGDQSLYGNTLGTNNVAIGSSSLGANSSGDYNVALGNNSLSSNSTGTNNIAIGYKAGNNSTNYSNKLYINSLNRLGLDADSTQSIIYGQQHTDVTKQELYLNANTYTKNLTVEDTITSDVQILNGTTITDVVTMKEAMEGTETDSLATGFMKLTPLATAPTPAVLGYVYVSTDTHIYMYNGTSWVQLDN